MATSIVIQSVDINTVVRPTSGIAYSTPTECSGNVALFVELQSAYTLLQMRFFEIAENADTREQLGTFAHQTGANVLSELRQILKDLKAQITSTFKLAQSKMGTPGYTWDWNNDLSDASFGGLFRSQVASPWSSTSSSDTTS